MPRLELVFALSATPGYFWSRPRRPVILAQFDKAPLHQICPGESSTCRRSSHSSLKEDWEAREQMIRSCDHEKTIHPPANKIKKIIGIIVIIVPNIKIAFIINYYINMYAKLFKRH